ncbi:MAG: GTP cyclohydrolase I [Flavobacteriales bacterium]|nr:GTP cyclohydrolase I [Flavobacteriales bacterium]
MKQNYIHSESGSLEILIEEMGDEHVSTSIETPLRPDAFHMSDEEKIEKIASHFAEIMDTLGLDRNDDSLSGTPRRVAKMYVKEIFSGLNPENFPDIKLFDFVPIIGKAHVAYISAGKVIGLSKINRIVQHFAKRPQVQERLTMQISNAMKKALETEDVAVVIDATHLCVSSRGVKDVNSSTVTSHFTGEFANEERKNEFLKYLDL